ncbi:MAG: hypothetical protein ACYCO5_16440, partial [Acidobacteriaceae bacterium]
NYINKGGPVQRISARTTQTHANPQRENKTAKKKFNASFSAACSAPEGFRSYHFHISNPR